MAKEPVKKAAVKKPPVKKTAATKKAAVKKAPVKAKKPTAKKKAQSGSAVARTPKVQVVQRADAKDPNLSVRRLQLLHHS